MVTEGFMTMLLHNVMGRLNVFGGLGHHLVVKTKSNYFEDPGSSWVCMKCGVEITNQLPVKAYPSLGPRSNLLELLFERIFSSCQCIKSQSNKARLTTQYIYSTSAFIYQTMTFGTIWLESKFRYWKPDFLIFLMVHTVDVIVVLWSCY